MKEEIGKIGVNNVFAEMEAQMCAGRHSRECAPIMATWFNTLEDGNLSMEALAFMAEHDHQVAAALESRKPGLSHYFAKTVNDYVIDNQLRTLRGL